MSAVSIHRVSVSYGTTTVLDGVDVDVAAGEIFFLLGASGCGKTTLLRTVAGFIAPGQGTVRIAGEDVTRLPTERRGVGMVFQNYALWPHLDVAGNVAFGLEVQGVPSAERQQRVAAALALVELADLGERRIGQLSGGQQQRVALARAIATRPRVLLLDEPLSNLDPRLRGQMRSAIRRICKESGLTAMYVTHDQAEALATADRIAFMSFGRIEQVGTPRDLYDRPASRAVAAFVGEANLLDAAALTALALPATDAATCCLRPERIRLGVGPLSAEIIAVAYEGAVARYDLSVAGVRLVASEAAPPERRTGETVPCAIEPGDLVVLLR
jgi:ABC-type Fe3+/spermidine/putrescine transport system ATPase subunit